MINPLDQLSLAQLRTRTSLKWRRYPPDVLPLWIAEMDVVLAEPVVAAVGDAMRRGDTGYGPGLEYGEAMADFAKERWDWTLEVARARMVPDVMLGAAEVLKLSTEPGAPVLVNSPVYPPFYDFIEWIGRRVVEVPLGADDRIDLAGMEQAFAADAGRAAYLLCNPHNPTGTVHTADELTAVADLARRHDVRVVADEIHAPLVLPGSTFTPYLTVDERGFSLLSASKGFNLAGLKAAIAVAGEAAVAELDRIPEEVQYGATHLGAIAHVAALREGREWLDALHHGLDANRRLLADLLGEHLPAVRYRPPSGTYLAWLDCRELGLGEDPAQQFLERGRVALSSGPRFGTGGAGHARLNLATSPAIITEAVRRMAAAVG